jgi:hypothetical protein
MAAAKTKSVAKGLPAVKKTFGFLKNSKKKALLT